VITVYNTKRYRQQRLQYAKGCLGNKKRCLSCKYALRPEDCNLSIQCNEDEVSHGTSYLRCFITHEQFGTKIITYTVSKTIPALKYLRFLLTTYPRLVGYSTVFVFIISVQAYISTMSTSHDMAE
jgi:hypothetical protein